MDLKTILQQVDKLETQLTQQNQNRNLMTLVSMQQQASTVCQQINQLAGQSVQKQLALDRAGQLCNEIQILIGKADLEPTNSTTEKQTHNNEYKQLLQDKESMKAASSMLDDVYSMGQHSLEALQNQGKKLHEIHEKIQQLTSKINIGDKSLKEILYLESFGSFLGITCVLIIILVFIFIKFVV